MEKYKVCLKDVKTTYSDLPISKMCLSGMYLYVKFDTVAAEDIAIGEKISLIKTFSGTTKDSVRTNCTVLAKSGRNEFLLTQPETKKHIQITHNYDRDHMSDSETWPGSYRLLLDEGCGITPGELAYAKRNTNIKQFELFAENNSTLQTVKITKFSLDNGNDSSLNVTISEEDYDAINNWDSYLSVSNNQFYCVDKVTGECKLWSNVTNDCYITWFFDNSYIRVPLAYSNVEDRTHLNMEYNIKSIYEDEYKEDLIPEIINLEKVRYSPILCERESNSGTIGIYPKKNNGVPTKARSLSFRFHFRDREKGSSGEYENSWHVTTDDSKLWSSIDGVKDISAGNDYFFKSDLLSYLNFEDTDVKYQKNKLKKSFIRLSFYDSNDQMSNNLLFYSTIFLDSNALYSKYNKLACDSDLRNNISKFVAFSGDTEHPYSAYCLTSQIDVTSNLDNSRSSEGFYLYLFGDDAPKENEEKTIYMKVEFNHAKYGRTIPMILWPKSGSTYTNLSVSNFFDSVYIRVILTYINGEYLYYFPDGSFNNHDGDNDVTLVLFEPVLTSNGDN